MVENWSKDATFSAKSIGLFYGLGWFDLIQMIGGFESH